MGKYTAQMESLTESVVASRRDCIQTVNGMLSETVNGMLSEFGRAQASMAEQQKSSLAAGCKARVKQVDSMREKHREGQLHMGRNLRRELAEATNQISISLASIRASNAKDHAAMANAQQKQFAESGPARLKVNSALTKVNGALMSEFKVLHQNMAQAQSQNLQSFTLGIRNEIDVMLDGFKQAHADMAGSLRERLSADIAKIRREVTELKRGSNEAQSELRDDLQAAAQIWKSRNGRGATMPAQASSKAESVSAKAESAPAKAESAPAKAESAPAKAESGSFGARSARPETVAKSQPSKRGSEMSDEERVLQVVRENPGGISATQIGEQVSLPSMAVGKLMKELIEEGKAQRLKGTRLFTPTEGAR
jgi:hypothetical protein